MFRDWQNWYYFHDIFIVLLCKEFRVFKEAEYSFRSMIFYGFLFVCFWKNNKSYHLRNHLGWQLIINLGVWFLIYEKRSGNFDDRYKEVIFKEVSRLFLKLRDSYFDKIRISILQFSKSLIEPFCWKELFEKVVILSTCILINPAGSEVRSQWRNYLQVFSDDYCLIFINVKLVLTLGWNILQHCFQ